MVCGVLGFTVTRTRGSETAKSSLITGDRCLMGNLRFSKAGGTCVWMTHGCFGNRCVQADGNQASLRGVTMLSRKKGLTETLFRQTSCGNRVGRLPSLLICSIQQPVPECFTNCNVCVIQVWLGLCLPACLTEAPLVQTPSESQAVRADACA